MQKTQAGTYPKLKVQSFLFLIDKISIEDGNTVPIVGRIGSDPSQFPNINSVSTHIRVQGGGSIEKVIAAGKGSLIYCSDVEIYVNAGSLYVNGVTVLGSLEEPVEEPRKDSALDPVYTNHTPSDIDTADIPTWKVPPYQR